MKPVTIDDSEIVDRRVLLAERDTARACRELGDALTEVKSLELKLAHMKLESANQMDMVMRLEDELQTLYRSSSWRWSAPLRRVSDIVQRLRASAGGPEPTPLPSPKPVINPPERPVTLSMRERAILQRLQRGG